MPFLLDANVLIALSFHEHQHYSLCQEWLKTVDEVMLCPIVEGALMRYAVRNGASVEAALDTLVKAKYNAKTRLIPDDLHYDEATWNGLQGYRQVTDFYLVELAKRHGAILATLDVRLSAARPEDTFLVQ